MSKEITEMAISRDVTLTEDEAAQMLALQTILRGKRDETIRRLDEKEIAPEAYLDEIADATKHFTESARILLGEERALLLFDGPEVLEHPENLIDRKVFLEQFKH